MCGFILRNWNGGALVLLGIAELCSLSVGTGDHVESRKSQGKEELHGGTQRSGPRPGCISKFWPRRPCTLPPRFARYPHPRVLMSSFSSAICNTASHLKMILMDQLLTHLTPGTAPAVLAPSSNGILLALPSHRSRGNHIFP
jgi:hypothetical protein